MIVIRYSIVLRLESHLHYKPSAQSSYLAQWARTINRKRFFGTRKLFSKKHNKRRTQTTCGGSGGGGGIFRHSATNVSFAILRIQERGIDFQGKRVLKWISTDFLGMSVKKYEL